MKINFNLFLAFLLIVFVSCNSNSPSKAASKFLNAFNEKKYDEARKHATPETIKLIDLMENLSKMSTTIDSVPHQKIEVISEKIYGDSASVVFREAGSSETEEVMLRKTDGKWLVNITKTDISAKDNSILNMEEEGIILESDDSTGSADEAAEVEPSR